MIRRLLRLRMQEIDEAGADHGTRGTGSHALGFLSWTYTERVFTEPQDRCIRVEGCSSELDFPARRP